MKGLHNNTSNSTTAIRIVKYYTTTELKKLCRELFSVSADNSVGSIKRMMAKISFLFYPENSTELTQHIFTQLVINKIDQKTRDIINENINKKLI